MGLNGHMNTNIPSENRKFTSSLMKKPLTSENYPVTEYNNTSLEKRKEDDNSCLNKSIDKALISDDEKMYLHDF
jgi:hypothetical protein